MSQPRKRPFVDLWSEDLLTLAVRAYLYRYKPRKVPLYGEPRGFVYQLTENKRNQADGLSHEIAEGLERQGYADPGTITGYIASCEARNKDRYRATVGRRWAGAVLAQSRASTSALEALIAGESLIGFHYEGKEITTESFPTPPSEGNEAWDWVTEQLIGLSRAGHRTALRQLTIFSGYRTKMVADAIAAGPDTNAVRMMRSLERGLRHKLYSAKNRKIIINLAARLDPNPARESSAADVVRAKPAPDPVILRPTSWLRLVRRCGVDQTSPPTWTIKHAIQAAGGERSYRDISPVERRYAYWVALELLDRSKNVDDIEIWTPRADDLYDSRPELAGLREFGVQAAKARQRYPVEIEDWPRFRPAQGWDMPHAVRSWLKVQLHDKPWPKTYTRISKAWNNLLGHVDAITVEAIETPCAIRYGTAAEFLSALPSDLRSFVSGAVTRTIDSVTAATTIEDANVPYIERLILLAGHIASVEPARVAATTQTLRTVANHEGKTASTDHVRRAAVWELGNLRPPVRGVLQELKRLEDDPVPGVAAAASAAVRSLRVKDWPAI